MALTDQLATASDAIFVKRVMAAMAQVAVSVVGTEPTTTTGHAQRVLLATRALQSPQQFAGLMAAAICCAQGSTLSTASTDADIVGAVTAQWTACASLVQ